MTYTNIDTLREKLNQAGATSTPFLFAINYQKTEGIFIEDPLRQSEVYFDFCGKGNKPEHPEITQKPTLTTTPIGEPKYREMFDKVIAASCRGEVKVTNLTVKTPIEINLSEYEIFMLSDSAYQLYLPGRFVCFSPERFIRIASGRISSNPMKGTIDAAIPNAESVILGQPKELVEHTATVQLICEELSLVSSNVRIERFRYIDRIATSNKCLLQVSSEVVGDLDDNYMSQLGDIVFNLLPAGSIAGSPKQAALGLIREVEGDDRGYYCGIAGYFDGTELDTAVLIRFIEREGDKTYFHSGGGITAQSVCQSEYQEVQNKIYLPFV